MPSLFIGIALWCIVWRRSSLVYGFLCSRLIKRNALSYFPCFIFDDDHSAHTLSSGFNRFLASIHSSPSPSLTENLLLSWYAKNPFFSNFISRPTPCTTTVRHNLQTQTVGNRMSCRKGINDKHTRLTCLAFLPVYAMLSQLEARHHRGKFTPDRAQ